MKKILGEPCPCCFKKVTQWTFNEAYRRKVANAKASAKKAKANGNHRHGRNKKLKTEQVEEIRKKYTPGWNRPSMRKLASEYSVSTTLIQRVLKGMTN